LTASTSCKTTRVSAARSVRWKRPPPKTGTAALRSCCARCSSASNMRHPKCASWVEVRSSPPPQSPDCAARPGLHAYCAAKAGVISLTRSASIELAKDKIRVNCICPGLIATPLTYNRIPGGEQVARQLFAGFQPWPRAGRPEDIAAMALFLASDDSEFVSGQAMVVDGAVTSGMGAGSLGQGAQAVNQSILDEEWSGPSFQMKRPS
jgi:NAD(P)-dependent dehydrogenase (short-subunit alcohol dehydrogenase family)